MKTPYLLLKIQDEGDLRDEVRKKQDEFLDLYSLYLATGFSCVLEELKLKVYELRLLDPAFNFHAMQQPVQQAA